MQTTHYISVKLMYVLVSDQLSFIPDNIVNMSKIINGAVKKYKFEVLKKHFPKSKHSFKN